MNEKNPIASTLIIAILFLFTIQSPKAQSLSINEFMSSNSATIADEDGDFEDWIEIYFDGEDMISLEGYGLSDNLDDPFKWTFPEVKIQPGQYLLVWASGKDRRAPIAPLHTNFSIKSEGEELLLTHPSGVIIEEIAPVVVPTDISYGRQPDGIGGWCFFDEPTPGESNTTAGYSEILVPPVFSHIGGFYSDEFELTLSHPDPGVTIYYTIDGSVPDPDNLEGTVYQYKNQYAVNPGDPFGEFLTRSYQSHHYTAAIQIEDRNEKPDQLTQISSTVHTPNYFPASPVKKGTVVRARAVKEGALSSAIGTHTFFINTSGNSARHLPVISIGIQEDHLFDYEMGIYTAGIDADIWRLNNPDQPMKWIFPGNFARVGYQWEYPAHFELFEKESAISVFRQDIGLRLHGGGTKAFTMKSLRIYARNKYGNPELNYPFFSEEPFDNYKRIILRNSGNDFPTTVWWSPEVVSRTLLRDAAIQTLVKHLRFETQAYRPSIVYINGEYWGIHNIRERFDKHYFEQVFGVDPDNIDLLEGVCEIIEGDNIFNYETRLYIEQNGVIEDEHYQYICTRIDVENFRDYHIANIYACNTDWPGNNIKFWRLRTDSFYPDAPHGHDGRLRWVMFDTDFGFGLWKGNEAVAHNTLEFATATGGTGWPNPEVATFLLRKFLENEDFKIEFINRFADLLNSTFHHDRVVGVINDLKDVIAPEIADHIHRWSYHENPNEWLEHVQVMIDFADQRPFYQRQHIIDQFELSGQYELTVDVSNCLHGHIMVNTIEITPETPGISDPVYPWSGTYFIGVPVILEAKPAPGFKFLHWDGDTTATDPELVIDPTEDFCLTAHFGIDDIPVLTHYWLFDTSLPNDQPLEEIESTYALAQPGLLTFHSALPGYPFDPAHPNWRKASMERRNAPTPINYRPEGNNNIPYANCNMRGIQIKQPFAGDGGENTLIFHLPSINLKELVFRFAAKDEGAADQLLLDYSVSEGEPQWITTGLSDPSPFLGQEYQLFEFDFSEIESTFINPHFKIRIHFAGDNMSADEGNRVTFNNFSLDGLLISGINFPPVVAAPIPLQKAIGEGEFVEIDLDQVFMDPENDPLIFAATSDRPQVADVAINQQKLSVMPLHHGDAQITVTAFDGTNDPVPTTFRVLVYPKPFPVAKSTFIFDEWAAEHPEHSYPDHMLFLQSNQSDPGLYTQLLFPYFIAHNDYHDDDQPTIGFPYNNSRRTRINGLGEAGLSLINTGRDRDLGGVLLALDTRGAGELKMGWLAGTMQQNERKYALRLQYRTNIHQPFSNLFINVQPVEYIANTDGHIAVFEDIRLPQELLELEYVQLLWRYYQLEGESGARAEIRLDDIEITDVVAIHEISAGEITLRRFGDQLHLTFPELISGELNLFDLTGRVILTKKLNHADQARVSLNNQKGVFIIRVVSRNDIWVKKVLNF